MRQAALEAAETVIRRHGVERTRIVDIARIVGVNHALLYRHFKDKAALIDAVSERWLAHLQDDLGRIASDDGDPVVRMKQWFSTLYRAMRERRQADPELYRSFALAHDEGRGFIGKHGAAIRWQLAKLVTAAMQSGQFGDGNPLETAVLLFDATTAFHHPMMIDEQAGADRQAALDQLLGVLIGGLRR
jgi:AcrR family transcriptional regulator